jgi:hypothetical protein
MAKISRNHDDWTMAESTPTPAPTPEPTSKKRGMIELNDEVMREVMTHKYRGCIVVLSINKSVIHRHFIASRNITNSLTFIAR